MPKVGDNRLHVRIQQTAGAKVTHTDFPWINLKRLRNKSRHSVHDSFRHDRICWQSADSILAESNKGRGGDFEVYRVSWYTLSNVDGISPPDNLND